MNSTNFSDLSSSLKVIKTRPLFVMRLNVEPTLMGETPSGTRRVGIITRGSFEGERLSGKVLGGGSDWQTIRKDGAITLDVRMTLETTDGALIGMTYRGLRHGSPEILKQLDEGENVDPASYYFRISPLFETSSEKYDWINRVVGVGVGHRFLDGPIYSVFEIE
jgi:hypothetical protein